MIFQRCWFILLDMSKYVVLETGGKQYIVKEGDELKIEKLNTEDKRVVFDKVLLGVNDGEVKVGTPYLADARVEAQVLETKKDKKKIVFRYHSKTRYRKLKGHRQYYTKVLIEKISF